MHVRAYEISEAHYLESKKELDSLPALDRAALRRIIECHGGNCAGCIENEDFLAHAKKVMESKIEHDGQRRSGWLEATLCENVGASQAPVELSVLVGGVPHSFVVPKNIVRFDVAAQPSRPCRRVEATAQDDRPRHSRHPCERELTELPPWIGTRSAGMREHACTHTHRRTDVSTQMEALSRECDLGCAQGWRVLFEEDANFY